MPLTLAALLLWGLSAPEGWGCLQCDRSVRAALAELRAALVPAHFQLPRLQARAQALLLGMEGRFFRDYALSAFVGTAGEGRARLEEEEGAMREGSPAPRSHRMSCSLAPEVDRLEGVATFLKNRTQRFLASTLTDGPLLEELVNFREEVIKEFKKVLRSYELKACDRKTCRLLRGEVLDCSRCQTISPKCIKKKYCFVDGQPRVVLEFRMIGKYLQTQPLMGIFIAVFLAIFFFIVLLISACTYRQNRKLLLQ
ncbi:izumo sperm-egg fusion protein 2 [Erethizon dorsatum]